MRRVEERRARAVRGLRAVARPARLCRLAAAVLAFGRRELQRTSPASSPTSCAAPPRRRPSPGPTSGRSGSTTCGTGTPCTGSRPGARSGGLANRRLQPLGHLAGARRQGFLGGLVRLRREGGQASKWVSTAPRGVKDRDCRDGPRAAESERSHWHAGSIAVAAHRRQVEPNCTRSARSLIE
jgi:hypothetical protein